MLRKPAPANASRPQKSFSSKLGVLFRIGVAMIAFGMTVPAFSAPPTVSISSPSDGSSSNFGGSISFQASVTDEDDEATITAAITWSSSLDGALGNGGSINVSSLAIGTHTITAQVTDSEALSGSDSITVTVNNNAPTVTITSPGNGSSSDFGASINFQADATDVEDNNNALTAAISWSSSVDGAIGSGGSINVNTLSVGSFHELIPRLLCVQGCTSTWS